MACSRVGPHMAASGRSEPHTAGRSGRPKMRQRSRSSSCTHRTPAGLPPGMPGMADVIDGAMQHAPQPGRQDGAAAVPPGSIGTTPRPQALSPATAQARAIARANGAGSASRSRMAPSVPVSAMPIRSSHASNSGAGLRPSTRRTYSASWNEVLW